MKKIYYNNRTLAIVGSKSRQPESPSEPVVVDSYKDIPILLKNFMENEQLSTMVLKNEDPKALFKAISQNFKVVEAAGGVVLNERNELLLIYRLEKWDLPKGKVETDEDVEEAALREVEEECGISHLILEDSLCKTYHIYTYKEKTILKVTHWFTMRYSGSDTLVPQQEEDITDAAWIPLENLPEYMNNTYGNIRDVVAKLIKEQGV